MNNFVSMVVAILEHAEVLTKDEAQKLVNDLHNTTIPDNYAQCRTMVQNLFEKHDISPISSKTKK